MINHALKTNVQPLCAYKVIIKTNVRPPYAYMVRNDKPYPRTKRVTTIRLQGET